MPKGWHTLVVPSWTETIHSEQYRGGDYEHVFIPKGVKKISRDAFANCKSLREVTFEEESELKIIEDYAFSGCGRLAKIGLPSALKSIGSFAFYGCYDLKDVRLQNCLEKIGCSCFSMSGLE